MSVARPHTELPFGGRGRRSNQLIVDQRQPRSVRRHGRLFMRRLSTNPPHCGHAAGRGAGEGAIALQVRRPARRYPGPDPAWTCVVKDAVLRPS